MILRSQNTLWVFIAGYRVCVPVCSLQYTVYSLQFAANYTLCAMCSVSVKFRIQSAQSAVSCVESLYGSFYVARTKFYTQGTGGGLQELILKCSQADFCKCICGRFVSQARHFLSLNYAMLIWKNTTTTKS